MLAATMHPKHLIQYAAVRCAERTLLANSAVAAEKLLWFSQMLGFNGFRFVTCRLSCNKRNRTRVRRNRTCPVTLTTALRVQVSLVDPNLCASLSKAHTAAMALTALSACIDALLAWELALVPGRTPKDDDDTLLRLGTRGIGAVAEGLPVVLAGKKDALARELLTIGSVCAGQLSVITPAPPTQVLQTYSKRVNATFYVTRRHNKVNTFLDD